MKTLGWLIGLFLLVSCQNLRQEVEPQQLANQPVKLIVACFISPQDTVLAAKVARSRPILDDETVKTLDITNAVLTLRSGSRSVRLNYHSRLRYYRADPTAFPVRAGETYTLTVQTPDGQQVEAQTTVPEPVNLQSVRLDSELVSENNQERKRFFARYFWTDLAARTDYYQTDGIIAYRCPACSPVKTVRQPVQFMRGEGNSALYTDQESQGAPMASGKGYMGAGIDPRQQFFPDFFSKPFTLTASLLHLNDDYYRYYQALARQLETDSNPFAEPVPIPTNIQGGLGCFGAYNRSTVMVTLN